MQSFEQINNYLNELTMLRKLIKCSKRFFKKLIKHFLLNMNIFMKLNISICQHIKNIHESRNV